MKENKQDNLVLNEQSIKRHIKRLAKVLKNHPGITVSDSVSHMDIQEIFSQSLGFKNWHELHALLKKDAESDTAKKIEILKRKNQDKTKEAEKNLVEYLDQNLFKPVSFPNIELYHSEVIGHNLFMPFLLFLMNEAYPDLHVFDNIHVQSLKDESYFFYGVVYKNPEYINSMKFKEHLLKIIVKQEQGEVYDFSSIYDATSNKFAITMYGLTIGKSFNV